ncbi:MAG: hypothetical protein ACJ71U_08355 [Terriglobales bacterium]|jgi:translation initiation factor 2B subunit (eIF-2B alpha/beta/delta family)
MEAEYWLNTLDQERAQAMRKYVSDFWDGKVDMLTYTPHDPTHFARVERNMQRLIPKERWFKLNDAERMVLTWCAWTHDVGMNKKCYPDPDSITAADVRKKHVEESAKWVRKYWKELRLTRSEAQVIADVIRFHSRQNRLHDCAERVICETEYIRARLVAAYLRLADAMEVGHSRPGEHEFDRFPLFQDLVSEERDEILFHWVKSFVVAGIAANHANQIIEIEFQNPKRTPPKSAVDSRKFSLLTRYVVNELREELETVESTLDAGAISSFHDVMFKTIEREDVGGESGWPKLLPTVINHLQMVYSPNSTGIARAALESLRAILDDNTDKSQELRGRLHQLMTSLNKQLERRNCHNEVARIRKRIGRAYSELEDAKETESVRNQLRNYVINFEKMFDDEGMGKLGKCFWMCVGKHCRQLSDGAYRFLLFGCSESVAGVLAKRKVDAQLTLYIAEGRPKTMHGAHNSPLYVDAESYAAKIREREAMEGISGAYAAKIIIIPDACVATAFARGDGLGPVPGFSAVLFGSNGVYYGRSDEKLQDTPRLPDASTQELLDVSMCVAHTVGHLGVAITANFFNVPIIVVAAAAKISEKPAREWTTLLRGNKWLTTYPPCVDHIVEGCKAKIDWTPREEHVPLTLLSHLITEKGEIDLSQKNHPLRERLRQWDHDVDVELDQ